MKMNKGSVALALFLVGVVGLAVTTFFRSPKPREEPAKFPDRRPVALLNFYGGNPPEVDPTGMGRPAWWATEDDAKALDALRGHLADLSARGYQRVMFNLPSGHPTPPLGKPQKFYSMGQLSGLPEGRRDGMLKVVSGWLAADPSRQAILYLGFVYGPNPGAVFSDAEAVIPTRENYPRVWSEVEPWVRVGKSSQVGLCFDYAAAPEAVDNYLKIRDRLVKEHGVWVGGEAVPVGSDPRMAFPAEWYLDKSPWQGGTWFIDNYGSALAELDPDTTEVFIALDRPGLTDAEITAYRARGLVPVNYWTSAYDRAAQAYLGDDAPPPAN